HLEDPLPRLVVGDDDHASKDPAIRGRAEDRRTEDAVEQAVGPCVVDEDELTRAPRALGAEMRLEAALPIRMTEARRTRSERQLRGHEIVVGDRIGGEVRQIAERERAKRVVTRVVEDLQPYVPRMAVSTHRRVLLRDARVRGDGTVEK